MFHLKKDKEMCPPPCGPRRARCTKEQVKQQRISKAAVEEIIYSGDYQCFFKMGSESELQAYEGCVNNLVLILHDGETTVKVAGSRSPYYVSGYRNIVMDAPCFPAVLVLRTEL